jgi:hypothetical protein
MERQLLKIKEKVKEQVECFFLFHLGFDAQLLIRDEKEGLEVRVEHDRVTSFQFSLNGEELEEAVREPARLEDFLLERLNEHRSSR